MIVSMTGPRGGKLPTDLHAMALFAVNSYAKQLGIRRLRTALDIRFHKKTFIDGSVEGYCEAVDNRNFIVDVCLYGNWLSTLAHEMVHVKQFAKNELDSALTVWKGKDHADTDYWDAPWEKEARRLQNKMVVAFEKELNEE